MDDTKNALAELAERLNGMASVTDVDSHDHDTLVKSQRIVAGLAKVTDDPFGMPEYEDSKVAVMDARAIAEEGAGDGK